MDRTFWEHVESLHPLFERLMEMKPVKISQLPKSLPEKCIYLFSDGVNHLYVGRTRNLRYRLRQHCRPSARQNEAAFAFRLARKKTGKEEPTYAAEGSRVALARDPLFAIAFNDAKARIREMDLRLVEETDPIRQALLEMYVAVLLRTPYNDFETH